MRTRTFLCAGVLIAGVVASQATAETGPSGIDPGLYLEWDAGQTKEGRPMVSGYVYNNTMKPAIKVRLLVEALDGAGQVIDRTVGFVVGAVPVFGRSYWVVPVQTAGARYRVTVAFFEWKEGSS